MSEKQDNVTKLLIKIRNKIITVFGDIKINKHFPWIPYYKPQGYQVNGKHVRELLGTCQPGDVLLRGFTDYFDGLFIVSWSHAGLVYSETEVIHSMAEGVFIEDILHFFRTDRVCVLRPSLNSEGLVDVLKTAENYKGTPYDFGFNFNNPKEVSCSEFVYLCFEKYWKELGMYKDTEKFLFIEKQTVRPALFLKFPGFKEILRVP